ncbi:hypothetical protein PoB_006620900 [Plakobranchus ocellatus]|uniref:Uncharacterized protein n=1 Tax=Plakobranchus ocellatus TaxID=259542 RepID=A0AAV4D6B4_9GAST|nr:hypothetical protein PoB_006620900 [Plakobranchus ocellatus]
MNEASVGSSVGHYLERGVGGTVDLDSEPALRGAWTILSRIRVPAPASGLEGVPESQRSPCCGLRIHENETIASNVRHENEMTRFKD